MKTVKQSWKDERKKFANKLPSIWQFVSIDGNSAQQRNVLKQTVAKTLTRCELRWLSSRFFYYCSLVLDEPCKLLLQSRGRIYLQLIAHEFCYTRTRHTSHPHQNETERKKIQFRWHNSNDEIKWSKIDYKPRTFEMFFLSFFSLYFTDTQWVLLTLKCI